MNQKHIVGFMWAAPHKELHLPRHSILKINNSIKVRRVLTEAAELHG